MTQLYDEQKHPLTRRIFHWVMALSILIMIGSGWRIYNASPIFPFTLPRMDHPRRRRPNGTGAARRSWRRHRHRLAFRRDVDAGRQLPAVRAVGHRVGSFLARLPAGRTASSFMRDFVAARAFRLEHRLGEYNAVQKVVVSRRAGPGRRDDPVRHRDLEAGADLSAGAAVRRLPGRAHGALPRDGRHRAFHRGACGTDPVVPRTFLAMVLGRATEPRHIVTSEDAR